MYQRVPTPAAGAERWGVLASTLTLGFVMQVRAAGTASWGSDVAVTLLQQIITMATSLCCIMSSYLF